MEASLHFSNGHFKGLMAELSKRQSYTDLIFVCQDQVQVRCHKFVIGAQSSFLKDLLISSPVIETDPEATIVLPGVTQDQLNVVLRFLYSGKLRLSLSDVAGVQEILEDVLKIDAKINIPHAEASDQDPLGECLAMNEEPNQDANDGQYLDILSPPTSITDEMEVEGSDDSDLLNQDQDCLQIVQVTSLSTGEEGDLGHAPDQPQPKRSLRERSNFNYNEDDILNDDATDPYRFSIENLPPPIPLPPRSGMIISRGEWIDPLRHRRKNLKAQGRVRKYNYKPIVYTIRGQSKASTFDAEDEDDGEHPCPFPSCSNVYARSRSLMAHVRRSHHANPLATCPECGKKLSSPSSLSKHLLSHRPRDMWPFSCPLCGRRFQAKADLPRHFASAAHKNDNLPPPGTEAWADLCNRSRCDPLVKRGGQLSWRQQILSQASQRLDLSDNDESRAIKEEPDDHSNQHAFSIDVLLGN